MHLLNPVQCRNPNDFPHFFWKQASGTPQSDSGCPISPCSRGHGTARPRPGQPPPALHSPTLSAQDKAKLQFSGLIARMPVQGRDRDSFVPAPSASVPGERLITDLALCAQPWPDAVRTSGWADKDKTRNSWRFWAVRCLLEQPSDTEAPVLFSSWVQIRKSNAAMSGADIPG